MHNVHIDTKESDSYTLGFCAIIILCAYRILLLAVPKRCSCYGVSLVPARGVSFGYCIHLMCEQMILISVQVAD